MCFRFEVDGQVRLAELGRRLRQGAYRPGPLRNVPLRRSNGRTHLLRIPTLEDRIAQSAVAEVLSRHLDGRMNRASFGYRPGRSVAQALGQVRTRPWVFEADIRDFFDEAGDAR
jgi:CRISPR-associated protein Cas1